MLTKTFYETEINPDLYNMLSTHSWVGVIRRNLFDNSLKENYDLWKNVKLQSLQFNNEMLLGMYMYLNEGDNC